MTEQIEVTNSSLRPFNESGQMSIEFSDILENRINALCNEVIGIIDTTPAPLTIQEVAALKYEMFSRLVWFLNFGLAMKKLESRAGQDKK